MKSEICDYDEENIMACWMLDAGRTVIHFTSSLSELLALRETVDEMVKDLMRIAKIKEDASKTAELAWRK